ncbi:hypothetical protein [Pseudomonas atacamensis]|uniref:hypothetical protein n=1 Tax=Pseudomonas atacamensis TaxID=2565368 RepID=UPI0019D01F37|nr:hypothetical protein [Pseudomonas atacamensis]QSL90477.1 hypothetical protein JWU58_26935 [Pseudomonas atacamensis]
MTDEYVLQDSRGNTGDRLMFHAIGGAGYTTNLDAAHRFTKREAANHNSFRETDKPWPLAYLVERHELAVDCQYVKPDDVQAALAIEDKAYLCVSGRWNGNDLIWLAGDGEHTADLSHAKVFPLDVAVSVSSQHSDGLRAIPKAFVDQLARKVVPSGRVNITAALKGTGVTLAKSPKARHVSMRCDHCGAFISEAQRFGDCPKCKGSNAP